VEGDFIVFGSAAVAGLEVIVVCVWDVLEVLPWLRAADGEGRATQDPVVLVAVDDGAESQQADHDEWFEDGADRHGERPRSWEDRRASESRKR
jgi:hypothetical protein